MKRGDLVYVNHYSEAGYYLIKGRGTSTDKFKRKYFILVDTKTGKITTAYEYNLTLVCAS